MLPRQSVPSQEAGLIKFLRAKAAGVGVTGSVYAAYAYFLALYAAVGSTRPIFVGSVVSVTQL